MEVTVDSSNPSNINTSAPVTKYGAHNLNTNWIVWYHSPSDKSWTIDSYKSILEIETVEDYLVLQNSWESCLPTVTEGMFFVMRRLDNGTTILPQWEDPNNKKGGCWSFKIDNTQAQGVWYNLCKFLIGETVCKRKLDQMTINGISISPRNVYDKEKAFCIIKIWNSDCRQNDISVLSDELNFLHLDEFKYNSHNENIERDAAKVTRYKERMRERENQRGGRGHGGRGNGKNFRNNIGRF